MIDIKNKLVKREYEEVNKNNLLDKKSFERSVANNILLKRGLTFTNKSILLLITFILMSILMLQFISSVGITPGRTTLNFEPGLSAEVPFSIVNTENKDMSVVFAVRGELANYITLNSAYSEFSSTENSKSFSYNINLPVKFEKPGLHEAEIVAMEMPKDIKETGAFVGATVSVITQLYVYVPYPNKYIDGDLNIIEAGADEKTIFLMPVINRGKLNIVNAKVVIDIYTSLNEKIITLESNPISLNSLERKEIVVDWESDVNPGKYLAVVTIVYDNEILKLEKEFNVGELVLEIEEVIVKDFELGGIAKFNALVQNKWSEDLKDVYLNILVYNDEGEIMADFKSPTYDINSLTKAEMVAYWDTAGISTGTYEGKLILKYGDKSTDRNIQLKITEYDIEILGVTGRVSVKQSSNFNINNLLVILLVFLIVANIVWFVVVKKILKKKK
ncbi:MAG: hypothetical protein KKF48_02475 [Nanoarchaeota archaeon]|nr:hypothetical protein [Nanoarchaeota archaeon]MBU1027886.1 hypothetical protein [Nanoarchaeota archaeon]